MNNTIPPSVSGHVGARWIRAALQVNPYGYHGRNSPSLKFSDEATYNSELLARCKSQHIEIIAITDHWCVDTAAGLVKDAEAVGIVALPGFEANTSEGVHLLVIFEAKTSFADINAAIGLCEANPGCSNGTPGASYKDILRRMTERGALVIPAHANVPNGGMLTGRTGNPLVKMVTNPELHAIGITPSADEAADQQAVLNGTAPYKRVHRLAIIYSDDICHPNTLDTEGAATWFKVSSPRLESLKLAVRTPVTRVAIKDPTSTPRAVIRKISWEGGFLDGVTLPLADDLTALIGGRGTGKSTVVESLRYALGVDAIGADAKRDHEGVVSKVLRSGTTIRLVVETVTPRPAHFTIERSVPNPPIVRDSSGAATKLNPTDVIGSIEIFGQHELAELAQDKASVARMLERFSGHTESDTEHDEILRSLKENRDRIKRVEDSRNRLEEELADIPRLQEQVNHYTETDLPARLEEQKRLHQDEAVFTEGSERLTAAQRLLGELIETGLVQILSVDIDGIEESSQQELLKRVSDATLKLSQEFEKAIWALSRAIKTASTEVQAAKSEWVTKTSAQQARHAEVLRQLVREGADPDKYLTTTAMLESLNTKAQRRTGFLKQLSMLQKERDDLLAKLASNEIERGKQLTAAIRAANKATNGVVIVKPVASAARGYIKKVIEQQVRNQRTQIMAAIEKEDFSPRAFVAAARDGTEKLEVDYNIRGAQAASIITAGEPLFRELEEMSVGQAVDVLLDTSPAKQQREYRRLEDLSKGQRATALLLLLLGAATSPLVIDQPEDDLDNRFIYDGIVQKLRELKGTRQVIVSTHNANVPVLGDAELIIALEGDGTKGWLVSDGVGSLDDAGVRKLAEHILEGGRAAFDARQHLYGF